MITAASTGARTRTSMAQSARRFLRSIRFAPYHRVDPLDGAARRGGHRAIGRKRGRLVRQRACGERHRPVQDRADPAAGPWRNMGAVEFAVLVDWLNNRRLLEPLDYARRVPRPAWSA